MADIDPQKVIKFFKENKSTYEIAELLNTYPNKIRRMLIKSGYTPNNRSQAQAIALKKGRAKHPTEGQERSSEVKVKISEKLSENYDKMSAKERAKRVEYGRRRWEGMDAVERSNFLASAGEGIRKASKEGSKLEKYLIEQLRAEFKVEYHKTDLLKNKKLHIDIYVPHVRTAIEIDGPAHFFPIWGEQSLARHIKADNEKSGLLIGAGFNIIRVKQLKSSVSDKEKRDIIKELLGILSKLGPTDGKLIELEIK